jgi:hypothetical protein
MMAANAGMQVIELATSKIRNALQTHPSIRGKLPAESVWQITPRPRRLKYTHEL